MTSDKQTAIIVGIGPFISRSLAIYLAKQGFRVGLTTRSQSKLDKLASELKGQTDVYTATSDAGDPASLTAGLDELVSKLGKVDVLIYNAARVAQDEIMTLKPDQFIADFRTAAVGTLIAGQWFDKNANKTSSLKPLMLVTGGTLDRSPYPEFASLSSVKAAQQNLAIMFSMRSEQTGFQVGAPLITQPIIPKEDGSGYQTQSDPDVIVEKVFMPFLDDRAAKKEGDQWTRERIF